MDLRTYLLTIARTYDRHAPMDSSAQRLLREAKDHLGSLVPAGLLVRGSGGMGTATFTPWVGLFDPDETADPGQGLYVVYLFAEDLSSVTLMLNQGVTHLREALKSKGRLGEFHTLLRRSADRFRQALPPPMLQAWDTSVDLGSRGWRQRAYEAGSVAARRYDLNELPPEAELRADLWQLVELYQRASLSRAEPDEASTAISSPNRDPARVETDADPLRNFRPKNDADYVAHLTGRRLRKQRRHETLIDEYGPALAPAGFRLSTDVHPRDLMLYRDQGSWLVEAKVVYAGNATKAVREAIGQLLSYRHFLHPTPPFPRMVALFTEEIGDGYASFLDTLNIASVWKTPQGWAGSASALADDLVPS